ncbi:MAG TPA: ribonuclease domain-containing protein [Mycobacteriales bacterium]|jgi:ribonuclease T1|nr:ribonuclease domain-containing protein [Mycobacteriales bacterium]
MLRTRRPLLVLIAIIALLVIGYVVKEVDGGSGHGSGGSTSGPVTESSLPAQARQTIKAIQSGGPFPYSQDGVVFRNDQHLLPAESSGYYHEYTVTTPGASTRGTRRIITSRNREFYYTSDHYRSFHRVQLDR